MKRDKERHRKKQRYLKVSINADRGDRQSQRRTQKKTLTRVYKVCSIASLTDNKRIFRNIASCLS